LLGGWWRWRWSWMLTVMMMNGDGWHWRFLVLLVIHIFNWIHNLRQLLYSTCQSWRQQRSRINKWTCDSENVQSSATLDF
jgi:hypothetical protein